MIMERTEFIEKNDNQFYSFVLPAFKVEYFKEAINSILAQTYPNFELIIVNDASPEDLDSIVYSYNDSRIHYIKNIENIGGKDLVVHWNRCLEYAKGQYIILASDDDVYSPQYLEQMNELVKKYPNVNVFRPRVQKINDKGEIIGIEGYLNEIISQIEFFYHLFTQRIYSGIPYYLFKKKALKDSGGFINFPLAWFSDDATVINLLDNGIVSTTEILFSFRISGLSISSRINTFDSLIKKIIATKNFYNWIKIILENTKTINDQDIFYKKHILSNIQLKSVEQIWGLVDNFSLKLIIQNYFKIKSIGGFKTFELLKIIFRKLIN